MITPIDLDLPPMFVDWRPHQLQLAAKIATSAKYAFMLDSPTGTGKSLIAAAAQRISGKKVVYTTTTRQLQDQILNDFPYAKTLKGRGNYVCLKYPRMYPNISAEDCIHSDDNPCPLRWRCPYIEAKQAALGAPLAVLNMAYFLAEANYVGGFSDTDFLVIDEAETLEEQLMSFISLVITQDQLTRLRILPPKYKTKFEAWIPWSRDTIGLITEALVNLEPKMRGDWGGVDFNALRESKKLARLLAKLKYFHKEVDNTWVWYPSTDRWEFKPTWVAKYADYAVWRHAKKVLMMSAYLGPKQLVANVGLKQPYEYVQLDSPFLKENRPIYYEPCANIVSKEMDAALPRLVLAVSKILEDHPEDKTLIHTVSYKIRDYLMKNVGSTRMVTHSTRDRADVLERFKKSTEPLVLLSPSMGRGVDLPDEECRVIIIAKCPYLDLGDAQVSRRVYASKDGNSWYAHKTVGSIVQMSGRGCRSATDHCTTYILDSQFGKLYSEYRQMFPEWWRRALIL